MQNIVLLTAAGHGERLGSKIPKQWQKIDGISITEYTLRKFLQVDKIDKILILYNKENYSDAKKLLSINSKISILEGGNTAQETRDIGLRAINANIDDNIIIHDAVRPLVSINLIKRIIELSYLNAIVPIDKNRDTLFDIKNNKQIYSYNLVGTQTPQLFKFGLISNAFKKAKEQNIFNSFYSPFELLNYYNCEIHFIPGELLNFKITYPEDIEIFKKLKDLG